MVGPNLVYFISGKFSYIQFNTTQQSLSSTVVAKGFTPLNTLQTIDILGVKTCPRQVAVRGQTGYSFSCDPAVLAVAVRGLNIPLLSPFFVAWG